MTEKWRRCDTCRRVKPVEDFTAAEPTCQGCLSPPVRSGPRTTTRASSSGPRAAQQGDGSSRRPGAEPAATTTVSRVATIAPRDIKGRGDPEVRARRARLRAVERLIERYPDDFAGLLAEERGAERL